MNNGLFILLESSDHLDTLRFIEKGSTISFSFFFEFATKFF